MCCLLHEIRLGEDEKVTSCGGQAQGCGGLTPQTEKVRGATFFPLVVRHLTKAHRVFRVAPAHITVSIFCFLINITNVIFYNIIFMYTRIFLFEKWMIFYNFF